MDNGKKNAGGAAASATPPTRKPVSLDEMAGDVDVELSPDDVLLIQHQQEMDELVEKQQAVTAEMVEESRREAAKELQKHAATAQLAEEEKLDKVQRGGLYIQNGMYVNARGLPTLPVKK